MFIRGILWVACLCISTQLVASPQTKQPAPVAPKAGDLGKGAPKKDVDMSKNIPTKTVETKEEKAKERVKRTAPTMHEANTFIRSEMGTLDTKARADSLRVKALASMRNMLKTQKGMNDNRKYELLLRSGEIHLERHDYLREVEIETYTQKWDNWEKAKKGSPPKPSYAGSKKQIDNAIAIFKTLVKQYPKHPRTDSALYALGSALARMDNPECVNYFQKLLKDHPKSPLYPDVYLALGEYNFDKHNVAAAIDNYKKVLNYKTHPAYIYAKYKLAWSYYNSPSDSEAGQIKNWELAARNLKDVIRLSGKDGKQAGKFALREEALNDLVMVWADLNAVEIAWNYFRSLGEIDKFYNMLERLGWIYLDQGKNDRAIVVYERLLREAPLRASSPKIHTRLLELYDTKDSTQQVVGLLNNMVEFYKPDSPWTKAHQKNNQAAIIDARDQLEKHVHRYGALYHDRAQKSKNEAYYAAAVNLYKLHLQEFPKSKVRLDIMYYMAEALYDLKRYEESSDAFYLVAIQSPPESKYKKIAADSMVDVTNEAIANAKLPPLPKPGSVESPIPLPGIQAKLIERMAAFIKLFPNDSRVVKMQFTSAKIYFDYGHYSEAISRYYSVAEKYPNTIEGRQATRTVLAFYADKKDWKNAITYANRFLRIKTLMDEKLLVFTTEVLRTSMFELAVQYEKEGEFNKSADQYLAFQKVFSKDPNADKAVYNAVINYYKAKNIDSALSTSEYFLSLYPDSKLRPTVMAKLASNYEKLVDLQKASKYYYLYYKEFTNDPKRREALYNAATLQRGLGQVQQSAQYFNEYIKMYPNSEEALSSQYQIAEMYERAGEFVSAVNAYDVLSKFKGADVNMRYYAQTKSAMISYRQLNKPQALSTLNSIGQGLIRDKQVNAFKSREMIAQLWFNSLEPKFNQYQKIEILNSMKIETEAAAKQKLLSELVNDYKKLLEIRNPEYMAAALYRVGQMHENFAQVLMKARVPVGFNEQESKEFQKALADGSKPLQAEAVRFYASAAERAKEIDAFSPWVKTVNDKMAKIEPAKFKAIDEQSSEPIYLGHYFKLPNVVQQLVKQ